MLVPQIDTTIHLFDTCHSSWRAMYDLVLNRREKAHIVSGNFVSVAHLERFHVYVSTIW